MSPRFEDTEGLGHRRVCPVSGVVGQHLLRYGWLRDNEEAVLKLETMSEFGVVCDEERVVGS
jgi:hypothetical protein